ncbi:MFS transporter [Sporosarcina aquimarina]|uniref:MFS transporter n=1 Tax=Sporosarcina aquimarina TaxID=114975 RepID=UPI001C8DFF3C|nr:MFS transporter [Sporosarcina aquimarina]MBY0221594.1 MFS transporter [Sporosarcina aquimarina]
MKFAQSVLDKESKPSILSHINFNLAVFCFWFSIYIYVPLFGVYLEKTGFSYLAIGIILGSYGITQILLRLPLGILSDVLYNIRKKLLILGFACSFLSGIILVFFTSFYFILIARLFAGVTAAMWGIATVMYSYYFRADQATKSMGTMQFNTVTTQFICMVSSGYIIHFHGWNLPFWLGVIASLLGVIFVWNIKEIHEREQEKPKMSFRKLVQATSKINGIKTITFLSFVSHALLFVSIFGFSPAISLSIGIAESQFIWLMFAFFIPHALISLVLMIFSIDPKYNRILLIACFALSAFFNILISEAESFLTMSMYHSGLGLALGFIFPILLSEVVRISPKELKMSTMGFYQSFYAFGILLGPMVGGYVAEIFGLRSVFTGAAILSSLSIFVFIIPNIKRWVFNKAELL